MSALDIPVEMPALILSVQRDCVVFEPEKGKWYCAVAPYPDEDKADRMRSEMGSDFHSDYIEQPGISEGNLYGPAKSADHAYDMMHDQEANPGGHHEISHDMMSAADKKHWQKFVKDRTDAGRNRGRGGAWNTNVFGDRAIGRVLNVGRRNLAQTPQEGFVARSQRLAREKAAADKKVADDKAKAEAAKKAEKEKAGNLKKHATASARADRRASQVKSAEDAHRADPSHGNLVNLRRAHRNAYLDRNDAARKAEKAGLSDAASQHRVKARTHNAGSKLPDDAHWVTINGHPVLIGGGKDAALSQDATCPACKGACQDGKCPTCGQTCQPKDDAVGDGATALRGDLRASHGEGQERDARGRFAATAQEAVDYAAKASKEAIGSPPGRRGAAARDAHGAANTAAVVALKESASGRSNDAAFKACARAANEYHHTADLHNDADLNSSDGHDSYHEDAADACRSAGEALQELANHHLQSWTGSTKPEDMAMSQTDTALADDLNLGHGLNIDLELGDVAGHEFHGNQYTHQGAVDAVKKASDATNSTKGARAGKRHVDASDDAKRLVKDGLYSAAASRCRDAAEGHANASEAPRLTQLERGQHRMAAREHIETAKYLEGAAEQHGQYLAGQRVAIKPEWQDPGDDARDFRVVEDRGNAVVITHDAGLPINPQQSVGKNMIEPYHDRPQTDLTALPAVAQSNAVTAAQQLHDDTHAAANDVSMSAYVEHKYHTTQAGQAASRALAAGDTPEAIQHHLDAAGHLREAAAVGRTVRGVYENRGLPVAKSAANDPEKLEDLATRHTSMAQGKRMSLQADEMRRQAIAAGWNPEDDDEHGRKYGDAHNANVQGRQNDFQIKGLSHDLPIELGDVAGHAFHGNQFTATESSAKANAAIRNYKLFPLAGTVQKGALAKSIASTSDNNVALVTAKKAIASGAAADHDKAAEQFQKAAKGHVLAAQHHEEDGSDVSLEFASMHHAAQKAAISAAREHEEESRRIRGAGEHVVRLPSAGRMQALRDNAAKAQAEAHPPRRPRDARLSLDVPLELGDVAGHEFRGNQYSAGQPKEPDAKKAIQYEQADYAARIAAGEAMNAHHHGGPPQALTPDIEDSMHHWIGNRLGDAAVKHMKAAKLAEAVGDQPGTEDHDEQARALMAFMHLHEHGASDHEFEDRKGKLKDHPAYAAMQERADAAMKTAQQAGKAYRASTASPGEKASLAVRASEAFADSAVKHRAAGSTNRASNHFGRARFYRRQAEQHAKG